MVPLAIAVSNEKQNKKFKNVISAGKICENLELGNQLWTMEINILIKNVKAVITHFCASLT